MQGRKDKIVKHKQNGGNVFIFTLYAINKIQNKDNYVTSYLKTNCVIKANKIL